MSRTNKNQKMAVSAQDRAREVAAKLGPAVAQVKPLARSTGAAAQRGLHASRVWAAPRVERGGQVLRDSVAPKVSEVMSSAARRIEPTKPRPRRWPTLSGITLLVTAAAGTVVAVLRKRRMAGSTDLADEAKPDGAATDEVAGTAEEPKTSASADGAGASLTS
jgi:hypothetical protein